MSVRSRERQRGVGGCMRSGERERETNSRSTPKRASTRKRAEQHSANPRQPLFLPFTLSRHLRANRTRGTGGSTFVVWHSQGASGPHHTHSPQQARLGAHDAPRASRASVHLTNDSQGKHTNHTSLKAMMNGLRNLMRNCQRTLAVCVDGEPR